MEYKILTAVPNLINICIDEKDGDEYSGRLYHPYRKEPVSFDNVVRLLKEMEALYDELAFPQSSVELRKFAGKKRKTSYAGRTKEKLMGNDELLAKRGIRGTFFVYVQYRQNATWQGRILWAEKKREEVFQSVLELLMLIDNFLWEEA